MRFAVGLCYENADEVVEAVRDAMSRSRDRIVSVDLSEAPLIDSSGLRALLQARRMCEEAGGCMRIGPLSEAAARVIAMSGLGDALGVASAPPVDPRVHPEPDLDEREEHWEVNEYMATSEPYVISELREKVTAAARKAGAEGDALCDIQIAVGEALTNAYRHGSPNKGASKISMRCMTCSKAVVVEIADEGGWFDPNVGGDHDPKRMRDHGMGIYLMRQAMDVVEFSSDCPGNRVRMIKWLPQA